jgi:dGTPase
VSIRPGDDLLSPGYAQADEERFVAEPAKRSGRTAFARDRARILHSSALRRLAAKTQVLVAGTADFPRTRLTHTLEVAQIGRELGASLGCDPDLVEVGCLAHDLGHPPFGHNGEEALASIAAHAGGFEGNAQTLRVLARLESKTFDADGNSVGLNLTRAGLDSAIKYPWPRRSETPKFGYYEDDAEIFSWARVGAVEGQKSFEAQVMDWADDVAYSVHDVEDAIVSGHLNLAVLTSQSERAQLIDLAIEHYTDSPAQDIEAAIDRLIALSYWPGNFDGSQQSLAALKNATSQLIGRFCGSAHDATRKQYGDGLLTRYNAQLIINDDVASEVAVLKSLANMYVMQREGADAMYRQQRDLLTQLVTALLAREGHDLEKWLAPAWDAATTDEQKLRVVIDQVASLTDSSAVAWHSRLT